MSIRGIIKCYIKFIKDEISLLLYRISGLKEENLRELRSLQDIHKGKRGFIICNGPSLKCEDLDKIYSYDEISIASNKIDKIFTKTRWRPTYYIVMDEAYQYSLLDTMIAVPAKKKFFRIESFITTRKVKDNCVWLKADGDRKLLENPRFSEDCSDVIYTIATVTFSMIQLYVHMGIREIYIIGCDNSYGREIAKDGNIINHGTSSYFAGSSLKDLNHAAATWEMNIAYEYARKYADEHGIKIYNATRGGHLEAFERVNFDSLF